MNQPPVRETQPAAQERGPVCYGISLLSDDDLFLFNEGSHCRLYEKLGSHLMTVDDRAGTCFAVWAPDAEQVSVIGDFNRWNRGSHMLKPRGRSGIWEGFIPGVEKGAIYKYHIRSRHNGIEAEKADPFAVFSEVPPKTGSRVWDLSYEWKDKTWMKEDRIVANASDAPISIYEVHIGSWRRVPEEGNRSLSYLEHIEWLVNYVEEMGFTHVEFLPVMEHPFYGSWGYQSLGYFAPTSRYGEPEHLMALIDALHARGIGVILDWVPSHFPKDGHGLGFFDGTHLFEHKDPREGIHPDWDSFIFNYGRNEVRSFLLSSAVFWLDRYHADGLRVDAVASMLYRDYSRKAGEWIPNEYGGKENIEAISFLRRFNEDVYKNFPHTQTVAEESTDWPMVSRPTYVGGLGFGMKWDMGWMHDTLKYMSRDPIFRKFHHNQLTFRMLYAFHENFILPLSHDEVVHGKGSLLGKMPGDDGSKFSNLRLLYGYMFAQPGKKLLFQGAEVGQWAEWSHEGCVEWHLIEHSMHLGLQRWVKDLNRLYRLEAALHMRDFDPQGFEWIDCNDSQSSVLSLIRKSPFDDDFMMVICNFTPVARENYRVGVPIGGFWREALNSDAYYYGGRGFGNCGGVEAASESCHGRPFRLNLTLPPLGVLFLKSEGSA
ncbi:MAG: 1,4-alpha-glucan branching protein GlgB [Planctomycetes bacterium]|nr:1,4-alpha-glucan branching protein GlgB [Planctomycetota bacterium]